MSIGMCLVDFGSEDLTWDDLSRASRSTKRDRVIPLSIAGVMEAGKYRSDASGPIPDTRGATNWLLADIEDSIRDSRDKDILVYVHGAKVNFYNSAVFAAQLDHFLMNSSKPSRRSMTSPGASW